MVELTKLNGVVFVLNSDLIEVMEETPDTTIRLITKNYYIVQESMEEVIKKVEKYKQACNSVYSDILEQL